MSLQDFSRIFPIAKTCMTDGSLPQLTSSSPPFLSCQDIWSWNSNDMSDEVTLLGPKQRIANFHKNWSAGSAGVRGNQILNGSRHYWEIKVKRVFGTSMMFGIATQKTKLYVNEFVNMLGEDESGWGLNHRGILWHNGVEKEYIKPFEEFKTTVIGLLFDGIQGTLTYYKDGVCLGVAFQDLDKIEEPLYPMVCSTAKGSEMELGVTRRDFVGLQDRCRSSIVHHLSAADKIDQLCLPSTIKNYILEAMEPELKEVFTIQEYHKKKDP